MNELPSTDEVVAAFTASFSASTEQSESKVLSLLLELHANNVAQWRREDAARRSDGNDAAVAAAKRDIDELNGNRHRLLEEIDAAVAAAVGEHLSAPPCTETPAMAYDRLSVLTTRISFTERAAIENTERDYAARLPVLHRQLAVLREAMDVLLDELRSGRKRFVPYESLKLYGSSAPPS
jgi:Protein of unknown function (DUF4254)